MLSTGYLFIQNNTDNEAEKIILVRVSTMNTFDLVVFFSIIEFLFKIEKQIIHNGLPK